MARFPLVPTAPEPERAILVGVEWRDNAWPLDRSLDELERLAHTAGAQCVARLSQRLVKPMLPLWQAAPAWLPALRPLLPRLLLLLLPQLGVLQLLPAAWSCLAPFS